MERSDTINCGRTMGFAKGSTHPTNWRATDSWRQPWLQCGVTGRIAPTVVVGVSSSQGCRLPYSRTDVAGQWGGRRNPYALVALRKIRCSGRKLRAVGQNAFDRRLSEIFAEFEPTIRRKRPIVEYLSGFLGGSIPHAIPSPVVARPCADHSPPVAGAGGRTSGKGCRRDRRLPAQAGQEAGIAGSRRGGLPDGCGKALHGRR